MEGIMKNLTIPEKHQLKIARDTLKMSKIGASIMGGMSHKEAREIIFKLTGQSMPNVLTHTDFFKRQLIQTKGAIMKTIEQVTIERIIGSTSNIIDRHKCLAALAYGEKRNCKQVAIDIILKARLDWLNWLTVTQRQWQNNTKNINKARHHDSIALREKYVRCAL